MKCDMQISYEMVSNAHVHQLTVSLQAMELFNISSRLSLAREGGYSVFEWCWRGICIFFSYLSAQISNNCGLLQTPSSLLLVVMAWGAISRWHPQHWLSNLLAPNELIRLVGWPLNKDNRWLWMSGPWQTKRLAIRYLIAHFLCSA